MIATLEKEVTIPLKLERAGVQGVEEMRQLTKLCLYRLTFILKGCADIYRARQLSRGG